MSVLLHSLAVSLLLLATHFAPRAMPVRMPGTADGKRLMLTYSIGGRPAPAAIAAKAKEAPAEAPKAVSAALSAPKTPDARATDQGSGTTGESALGNGNINIASVQQHPRPEPDLSALAHGAGGQVIMDAVIDEQGKISQLTLVHGLGGGIDETVLATVRNWTFNPATKDGKAISSEQEILLYYERG
jgi:protein TonB